MALAVGCWVVLTVVVALALFTSRAGATAVLVILLLIASRNVPNSAALLATRLFLRGLRRSVFLAITISALAVATVAVARVVVTRVVVSIVVVASVAVPAVTVARVVVTRVSIARVAAARVSRSAIALTRVARVSTITATGRFILAVNLDTVHKPVGVLEVGRVGSDIVLAVSQGRSLRIIVPDVRRAGPVTAESSVEDDVVFHEVIVDIATLTSIELGSGSSPGGGAGVARLDVLRNLTALEEPDGNIVGSPFGSVHSATDVVETITIVLVIRSALTATF